MPDDNVNQTPSDPPTPTREEKLAALKASMPAYRLYTYRKARTPIWAANLTERPFFATYLGRRGWLLPVVTNSNVDTAMQFTQFRPVKSLRKRLMNILKCFEDSVDEKIAVGSYEQVLTAVNTVLTARAAAAAAAAEQSSGGSGTGTTTTTTTETTDTNTQTTTTTTETTETGNTETQNP